MSDEELQRYDDAVRWYLRQQIYTRKQICRIFKMAVTEFLKEAYSIKIMADHIAEQIRQEEEEEEGE